MCAPKLALPTAQSSEAADRSQAHLTPENTSDVSVFVACMEMRVLAPSIGLGCAMDIRISSQIVVATN